MKKYMKNEEMCPKALVQRESSEFLCLKVQVFPSPTRYIYMEEEISKFFSVGSYIGEKYEEIMKKYVEIMKKYERNLNKYEGNYVEIRNI